MESFVIPADYGVALVDAAAYPSFVAKKWSLPQIQKHFVAQMNQGTILPWGTGAPGNWRIDITDGSTTGIKSRLRAVQGYREFRGYITATGTKLHLTSYDELTMVAQFKDRQLPSEGSNEWFISICPGEYECRVVQLYDPEEAESEEVFNQETPHFLLILTRAKRPKSTIFDQVPWLAEGDS
ncbi:MAG TPA: hypothetical protein VGB77_07845 [Abditibacteriaceae bacterium]|jgi:hypothetical protein